MPSKDVANVSTKQTATAVGKATQQLRALFTDSQQGMYLYQDDHNKSCNQAFATLLGYPSPDAWAGIHTSFPPTFVAPQSQEDLVDAYQDAMANGVASQVAVTWKRKDGKTVATQVILVPFDVDGERLALHFVRKA